MKRSRIDNIVVNILNRMYMESKCVIPWITGMDFESVCRYSKCLGRVFYDGFFISEDKYEKAILDGCKYMRYVYTCESNIDYNKWKSIYDEVSRIEKECKESGVRWYEMDKIRKKFYELNGFVRKRPDESRVRINVGNYAPFCIETWSETSKDRIFETMSCIERMNATGLKWWDSVDIDMFLKSECKTIDNINMDIIDSGYSFLKCMEFERDYGKEEYDRMINTYDR